MKTYIIILFFLLIFTKMSLAQGYWTKVGDMPEIRYAHTINELNGKVYVVGGATSEGSSSLNTALIYDTTTCKWTQISLYNDEYRVAHCSCIIDNKLYVIGGSYGSTSVGSTMDMYDPNTGVWERKNPMNIARGLFACAVIGNNIYVFGTYTEDAGSQIGKSVEVYNTANNEWTKLKNMPSDRYGHSAIAVNGKIFVLGGATNDNRQTKVDIYDPQTDTWTTTKSSMPTGRYGITSNLVNNKIYVIGGWASSSVDPYDKVEIYDYEKDKWEIGIPLPDRRAVSASIVHNNEIYVYGGTNKGHPLIGTSEIYKFSFFYIFAVQSYVDRTYARKNIDTVLFRTKFSNIYNHPFTPQLIYINSDTTQIDSITLFDDGKHGDIISGDEIYGGFIPPQQAEDFYRFAVSIIDKQNNKYFIIPDSSRFTTAGPVTVDSVTYLKGPFNSYYINPFVKNHGNTFNIKNVTIKMLSNDPWVLKIKDSKLSNIPPDTSIASNIWSLINYDSSFPGYFNIKFEIMSDGYTYWTDSVKVIIPTVGIDEQMRRPLSFNLEQNYPNPFNPSTTIKYALPFESSVEIKIYNMIGQKIEEIEEGIKEAGYHNVVWQPKDLSSGVYFYLINVKSTDGKNNYSKTLKMLYMK